MDINKVRRGLECCVVRDPDDSVRCVNCPYRDPVAHCLNRLKVDALAVINELSPQESCGPDYCEIRRQTMSRLAKYDETAVESDAVRYLEAHAFLERLKQCTKSLDRQQVRTLRGQALSGDVEGAERGLMKLMGWRSK